jgi:argininosuccinate lyase
MAPEMRTLNDSLSIDFRLWRQDIRGSRSWARALCAAGVLSEDEAETLDRGLASVAARLGRRGVERATDEDVHSLVERLLFKEVGEVAGKLHTGRSRNDQVATDLRLWGQEAASRTEGLVVDLLEALVELAERSRQLVMPGYTHLQQAQPIRASQWALAHFWAFLRDRQRVRRAADSASVLPLGSGAIAGCPFPVDRERLRQDLGFRSISENSVDAVSDRDWVVEMIFVGSMIGVHLSRLAEDLVLFSSTEFGFLRLGDGYCTGSSLMPQKRNPDVAELARGKSGRLVGNLTGILTLIKGLPTGYNRDLQEDKALLFDTVDTLTLTLPPMAGAVGSAEFRRARLEEVLDSQLLATDLAEYLVRRGKPFRASHEVVGKLVRIAEARGRSLNELPFETFREVDAAFDRDVHEVFGWERSVESRSVPGGSSTSAIQSQLEEARRHLAAPPGAAPAS